jgi:hexosaminidase
MVVMMLTRSVLWLGFCSFVWGGVWPVPQIVSYGTDKVRLDANFEISCSDRCPSPLQAALLRYQQVMTVAGSPVADSAPSIARLSVDVADDEPLRLGIPENYTLRVPRNGVAVLTAPNQWAALRGLESFSQLFRWSGPSVDTEYVLDTAPVEIVDWPRFPWRSILIDSSRHYLSVSSIKSTLDAMSYAKVSSLSQSVPSSSSASVLGAFEAA